MAAETQRSIARPCLPILADAAPVVEEGKQGPGHEGRKTALRSLDSPDSEPLGQYRTSVPSILNCHLGDG